MPVPPPSPEALTTPAQQHLSTAAEQRERGQLAEARALVAFASLRHLQAEVDAGVLVGFELSEVLSVEMSWSRASTAWVYRRRTAPAQPTAPS